MLGVGWCIYLLSGPDWNQKFRIIITINMSSVYYTSRLKLHCSTSSQQMAYRWCRCRAMLSHTWESSWAWLSSVPWWSFINTLSCIQPDLSPENFCWCKWSRYDTITREKLLNNCPYIKLLVNLQSAHRTHQGLLDFNESATYSNSNILTRTLKYFHRTRVRNPRMFEK